MVERVHRGAADDEFSDLGMPVRPHYEEVCPALARVFDDDLAGISLFGDVLSGNLDRKSVV